jgi:hypothetical protein
MYIIRLFDAYVHAEVGSLLSRVLSSWIKARYQGGEVGLLAVDVGVTVPVILTTMVVR